MGILQIIFIYNTKIIRAYAQSICIFNISFHYAARGGKIRKKSRTLPPVERRYTRLLQALKTDPA